MLIFKIQLKMYPIKIVPYQIIRIY